MGVILEITNIALSIISCTTYIVETYYAGPRLFVAIVIEAVTVAYFSAYFLLGLLAAERKTTFLLRWFSLIDVVCIAPVVVITHNTTEHPWVLVVRLISVIRILYVFQIHRFFQNEIGRQIFFLAYNFLSVTYVSASIIEYVENQPAYWIEEDLFEPIPFHDCYYFIFTTLTTIGYGDIVPRVCGIQLVTCWNFAYCCVGPLFSQTQFGRMTIVGMMAVSLLTIPKRTNKLISLLSQQSPYVKSSFSASKDSQHIIVSGSISSNSASGRSGGIIPFFLEFFHEDHGVVDRNAAVLAQGHPSQEMVVLLSDPKYSTGICYMEGDVLEDKDLRRAAAEKAKAAFVLCDKFSSDKDAEDASTILRALSLKRYVFRKRGKDIVTFVQLIRPENKQLFLSTAGSFSTSMRQLNAKAGIDAADEQQPAKYATNIAVCVEEIKFHLLSQSCICPGLTTLVFNLVATNSVDESALAGRTGEMKWMQEYIGGASKEIYRIPLSVNFEGLTFLQACKVVYQETGCIMFALEVNHPKMEPRVILNPVNLPLPDCIVFGLFGYVIAEDKREADIITNLGGRPRRNGIVTRPGIRNVFAEVLTRQRKFAIEEGAYAPDSSPTFPASPTTLLSKQDSGSPDVPAFEGIGEPAVGEPKGCLCCRKRNAVRPRAHSTAALIAKVRSSNLETLDAEVKQKENEGGDTKQDVPSESNQAGSDAAGQEEQNLSFGSRSKGRALLFKAAISKLRKPAPKRLKVVQSEASPVPVHEPAPAWLPAGPVLSLSTATILSIYNTEVDTATEKPDFGIIASSSVAARSSFSQNGTILEAMAQAPTQNPTHPPPHPGLFRPYLSRAYIPTAAKSERAQRKASLSHVWEYRRRGSAVSTSTPPPQTAFDTPSQLPLKGDIDPELESLLLANAPFSTKNPVFRNHIILCCGGTISLPELHHFVRPLRASYLQE